MYTSTRNGPKGIGIENPTVLFISEILGEVGHLSIGRQLADPEQVG